GSNYHNSGSLATSVLNRTVTGLPSNGSTVYARLYSLVGGAWVFDDYTYTASTAVAETVSTPTTPTGSASGAVGTSYSFTTGGSTSSLANPVQYQFDWGDGSNSGWLAVGTTSAAKTWAAPGTYSVRAQARSSVNTAAVSALSSTLSVTITGGGGGGGSTRGVMTSPANGVTFASTTVTFTWSAGPASTGYYLYVGSTPGGTDYLNSGALGAAVTSRTVTGLPNDARTVYARLWSQVSGAWVYDDYSYIASGTSPKAQMTTPVPGSTVSGSVTFTWTAGTATGYWLYIGNSAGSTSIHNSGSLPAGTLSRTVTVPAGAKFVRLWSLVSGAWVYNDYTYN
ncbi:MAG: hypothetical protein JNG86_13350, partial [Verrucomicrobiaceae bacterium]|nr:hypothetical protein [Verrucomicrobiaceae bacterium]